MFIWRRENLSFLEIIGVAEEWLKDIKESVPVTEGEHSFATASQVSHQVKPLVDIKTMSRGLVVALAQDIFDSFVVYDHVPRTLFWEEFHEKLKVLEGSSIEFRRTCIHHEFEHNKNLLVLHQVCDRNPLVEVVKTLLEIIPLKDEEIHILLRNDRQYNRLHQNEDRDFPLNLVMKYGGWFKVNSR